jgi:hypothetical protein
MQCPPPFHFILPLLIPLQHANNNRQYHSSDDKCHSDPGDPFPGPQIQLPPPVLVQAGRNYYPRVRYDAFHIDIVQPSEVPQCRAHKQVLDIVVCPPEAEK